MEDNDKHVEILWLQYIHYLNEFARQMKGIYDYRKRTEQPITIDELNTVKDEIHKRLNFITDWKES